MLGTTQFYIITGVAILLFGGALVTKAAKSIFKTKKDIQNMIDEETANDEKTKKLVNS